MKIIINGNILDKKPTGVGVYTQNIINNLSRITDEMLVFSWKGELDISTDQHENIPSSILPSKGIKGNILRLLWNNFVFPFKVSKNKGDVVLSTVPESIAIGRTPYIVIVYDVIPLLFPDYYKNGKYIYKYYIPLVLKRASRIIAVSESTKRDIVNIYGIDDSKITVVYCGYNKEHFKKIDDSTVKKVKNKYNLDDYILYVGNILPHKNIKKLVEAYKLVNSYSGDLVLVGSKSEVYFKEIQSIIKDSSIQNRVKFLDYVPYHDLPALISGAKLFVYPSLYEGFGIPLLEAMACGTPVITSNVSSLPEVGGDAAVYVDPYNEKKLAYSIEKVLTNKDLQLDMVRKGLERCKFFSWEKAAYQIEKVIKEI
ncbi:glycosyltransferase family 4 protein [Aeribacillus alveayuensis]|uniref:Glycosyltransferase involved in cell wall biosynthesis n=1 Tax=Aeribacillus alveayuensis TaxID=279215 RepID=A0ABT9VNL1_9BACI|nr:glycosyltransferase involved in cell wall biosynthesis [Bacillus alveayuensis]